MVPAVDACLRLVAQHLLVDATRDPAASEAASEAALQALQAQLGEVAASLEPGPRVKVADCLHYLRDRVGVPRDMSLPAAQHFRARLNWAADALLA